MRKRILLAMMLTCSIWSSGYAQRMKEGDLPAGAEREQAETKENGRPVACRKLYLGVSAGINNPAGFIGVDIDVPVLHNLSIDGGYGSGTWGDKAYVGARYYLKECHKGWAFGAGVSRSAGITGLKQNIETVYGREDVILDLKPQTNLFLGAYYFCKLGRKANRVYVEGGYSIPFSQYSYTETQGDMLTETSDKIIKVLSPHGLIVGVGFSFALIK